MDDTANPHHDRPNGTGRVGLLGAYDDINTTLASAAGLPVYGLTDSDLITTLESAFAAEARATSVLLGLIREADSRNLARRVGATSTVALLKGQFLLTPHAARTAITVAKEITGSRTATGDALATAETSYAHVAVIVKGLTRLPASVPAHVVAEAEQALLGYARRYNPDQLATLVRHLVAILTPPKTGPDGDGANPHDVRRLHISKVGDSWALNGTLDDEGAQIVSAALEALARPRPCGPDPEDRDRRSRARRLCDALVELAARNLDDGNLPTNGGVRPHITVLTPISTLINLDEDTDTGAEVDAGAGSDAAGTSATGQTSAAGQTSVADVGVPPAFRRPPTGRPVHTGSGIADSVTNGTFTNGPVTRAGTGTACPTCGTTQRTAAAGSPRTPGESDGANPSGGEGDATGRPMTARAGSRGDPRGPATYLNGEPVPHRTLQRLACDSIIARVVLNPAGVPLNLGRDTRTVTPAQRRALIVRDGGCAFPMCDRPPAWCDCHHIKEWTRHRGPTDLGNLVMLCKYHHHEIHSERWTVTMAADGFPDFIPPVWIDPEQKPRRNPHRHSPDLFTPEFTPEV